MAQALSEFSEMFVGFVWGLPLVFTMLAAGLLFTLMFRFIQFRHFKHAIDIARGKFDNPEDKGEITHFQALCAALSATIGLGNIAGVAVAISTGGPGALFWMWIAAVLGMATKFTSISLALFNRDESNGHMHGGPMFTIKNGLGKKWMPLAFIYAGLIVLGSFGAGNMFQSNQLAAVAATNWGIPIWFSGVFFTVLSGIVLIGGIKRIGKIAGKLVPFMVILYFLGALGIVFVNIDQVPALLGQIFSDAFTGTAAVGGFTGVAFREVLVQGIRRAMFSNEAGMGSAAIAHSAAKSKPVMEGIIGSLGPFIDTIVVCTITALVMLLTGVWSNTGGLQGADLTASAFATVYGVFGSHLVTLAVVLFAFSTIISWSYYGEQAMVFMFGEKSVPAYKLIFVLFVFVGAMLKLQTVLNFSDACVGLLALPTLLSNILLSKKLKGELKTYEQEINL